MNAVFTEVVEDLAAEHSALAAVLDRMTPEQFELPTHAPGWTTRDQVAHLARFDETAALSLRDPAAFRADIRNPANAEPAYLARGREMTVPRLLDWWREASGALVAAAREADPASRLPWYGPALSAVSFVTARLMETWSHGLDVVDVVGIPRPDTDRLRHVAFIGIRARPYSYTNNGMEMPPVPLRVSLLAPSGATWELGEPSTENIIRGSATDFCRVVTRRRHPVDTHLEITGPAANEWMGIAQAFAGPPGDGRQPGEFPMEPTP